MSEYEIQTTPVIYLRYRIESLMKMFSDMKSPCEMKETKTTKSNKWRPHLRSVGTVAEIACHLRHLIGSEMLVCSSNFLRMSLALFHFVAHAHWCWFSVTEAYCFPVHCNYSFLSTKSNLQYGCRHKKHKSRYNENNRADEINAVSFSCSLYIIVCVFKIWLD